MASSLGTILVVGGCGFVGQHIIDELLQQDSSLSISVLDLRTSTNQQPSVTYYTADITKKSQVEAIINKVQPRTIFHTVSPHPLERNRQLLYDVNVLGTRNIVECAQKVVAAALVYTSSTSVVHDHYSPLRDVTESLPVLFYPEQLEHYSHTKALAEKIVLEANGVAGLRTVAIRPTTIYGEGDLLVTANLCRNAITGRAKNQLGDGRNLMDATYVGNLAYAEVLAAQALVTASFPPLALPSTQRVEGEAFFLRNDERYPFWEINRLVARMAGFPVRKEDIRVIPRWLVMILAFLIEWFVWGVTLGRKEPLLTTRVVRLVTIDRTFCIDKIKQRFGYRARFSTEEGLERAVGWYMREVYGKEKKTQ